MSTRVVKETHVLGNDHVWVPTEEEFKKLDVRVGEWESKCANAAAKLDRRLDVTKQELVKQQEACAQDYIAKIDSLKKELAEQLSGGNWRAALESAVGACVKDLEKRIGEIGELSAKQVSDMVAQLAEAESLIGELNQIKENATKAISHTVNQAVEDMSRKVESLETGLNGLAKSAELAGEKFEVTKRDLAEASASVSELLEAVNKGRAEFDEGKNAAQDAVAKVMSISAEANEIREGISAELKEARGYWMVSCEAAKKDLENAKVSASEHLEKVAQEAVTEANTIKEEISVETEEARKHCATLLKKSKTILSFSVLTGLFSVLSLGLAIWMYFR